MKRTAFLLLLAMISLASCENIEDNSPALQGEIDSTFFKASVALFTADGNGRYVIQGADARKSITLALNNNVEGFYNLPPSGASYATYEDLNGNVYSTTPFGSGQVDITDVTPDGALTGSFAFMAVRPGIDTVYVSKGKFYEVPPSVFNDEEDTSANDGTLGATINGTPFTPLTVVATNTGNFLFVVATSSSTSILLQLPSSIEEGTYNLPGGGIQATYSNNGVSTDASSGTVTIDAHDMVAGTISGSFSFQAGATTVNSGAFDIAY